MKRITLIMAAIVCLAISAMAQPNGYLCPLHRL